MNDSGQYRTVLNRNSGAYPGPVFVAQKLMTAFELGQMMLPQGKVGVMRWRPLPTGVKVAPDVLVKVESVKFTKALQSTVGVLPVFVNVSEPQKPVDQLLCTLSTAVSC